MSGARKPKKKPQVDHVKGRPLTVFTPEQLKTLRHLAAIDCSYEEIAAVMDVAENTLRRHFGSVIEKGRHEGKASLKRSQFRSAVEKENVTMQIWLGKVKLGQTETVVDATDPNQKRKPSIFRIGGQVLEV